MDKIYQVLPIENKLAQEIIIKEHYLHRKASCSWAFGLFSNLNLVGVVMFGSSVSHTLCIGICGPDEAKSVVELTRLYIYDGEPNGTASWFVARALRQVPREIIVAFADPTAGHHGGVYQALNFIYTGLGPARKRWFNPQRPEQHTHRGRTNNKTYKQLREEGKLIYIPAVRKHRYVYFQG